MNMNSPMGKEILALVRKADYAHAGEEEAIEIVFKDMPRNPGRLLLDVGCGRGGTAHYLQEKGFGKVTGIDIEPVSIEYARRKYPDVEFATGDCLELAQCLCGKFDIIYLFNVFYAFPGHLRALKQLRLLSRENGQLIIFDYLLKSASKNNFPFKDWNPLDLSIAQELFSSAGWRISETKDLSDLYKKWYKDLVSRIEARSKEITVLAGKEWFDFVRSFYGGIVEAIEGNLLGGAVIYAQNIC